MELIYGQHRAIIIMVMQMQGIYIIKNKINDNCYIGQSVNIERRFKEHLKPSHKSCQKLKEEITKYGKDNFYYEVLELCDLEFLDKRERYYISKLKPKYNTQKGGGSIHHHSVETKKILKEKGKIFWDNLNEEQKNKIISNFKRPEIGHIVKEETRQKLRYANLGKKQSQETINKRINSIKNSGYVRKNEKHKKPIICIETGEIFDSVKSAMDKYNLTCLVGHLKGRYKTCKGNHYKYYSVTTMADECKPVE